MTFGLVSAKLQSRVITLPSYELEFVTPEDNLVSGIAFLISEDNRITAKAGFDALNENTKRNFQVKFDYWLTGKPYKGGYHKWDNSQYRGKYTNCHVFTHPEKRVAQRLYGFLCHPKRSFDLRYRLCVLVRHARKTKHETDETDLKIVEEIRICPVVQKTISEYFRGHP